MTCLQSKKRRVKAPCVCVSEHEESSMGEGTSYSISRAKNQAALGPIPQSRAKMANYVMLEGCGILAEISWVGAGGVFGLTERTGHIIYMSTLGWS